MSNAGNTNQVPNSANAVQQVDHAITTSIHIQNQAELDRVNQRAELDRISRDAPFIPASTSMADKSKIKKLKTEVEELAATVAAKDKALAEKDALILEWMHSNEAFKRLARQFGKKLGVSDEERVDLLNQEILNAAEEDPKFEKTELKDQASDHMKTKI